MVFHATISFFEQNFSPTLSGQKNLRLGGFLSLFPFDYLTAIQLELSEIEIVHQICVTTSTPEDLCPFPKIKKNKKQEGLLLFQSRRLTTNFAPGSYELQTTFVAVFCLTGNAFQPCWAGMTTANPADASRPTLGQLIIVIRKVPRGLFGKVAPKYSRYRILIHTDVVQPGS